MARPGQESGFDYYTLPYNPKWAPMPDRQWAESFIDAEGREDFEGFRAEFRKRHRLLSHNHGDAYLPPSVDFYLRHDATGQRMDIDLELAAIPMTEEEIKELAELKQKEIRERRRAALKERGIKTKDEAPVPRAKLTASEVASRMD